MQTTMQVQNKKWLEIKEKKEDWWGGAAWSMEGLTERCWNAQANSIWGVIGTRKVGQR